MRHIGRIGSPVAQQRGPARRGGAAGGLHVSLAPEAIERLHAVRRGVLQRRLEIGPRGWRRHAPAPRRRRWRRRRRRRRRWRRRRRRRGGERLEARGEHLAQKRRGRRAASCGGEERRQQRGEATPLELVGPRRMQRHVEAQRVGRGGAHAREVGEDVERDRGRERRDVVHPEGGEAQHVARREHEPERRRQRRRQRVQRAVGPLDVELRLARARVAVGEEVQGGVRLGRPQQKLLVAAQLHKRVVGDVVVALRHRARARRPQLRHGRRGRRRRGATGQRLPAGSVLQQPGQLDERRREIEHGRRVALLDGREEVARRHDTPARAAVVGVREEVGPSLAHVHEVAAAVASSSCRLDVQLVRC